MDDSQLFARSLPGSAVGGRELDADPAIVQPRTID
jgi:hypothetical protein